MTAWIENLPEIGGRYLDRGRDIEANKVRLRAELASWLQAEASLWTEVAASGLWDKAEVTTALTGIDPGALPFLPAKMPKSKKEAA